MEYILITNNDENAKFAESCGVQRIMVDLEILGKEKRQGHLNTVISGHQMDDVRKIRNSIIKSKLLVRINPLNPNSKLEIDKVIDLGADIIMLPMFKTSNEVETFIKYVNGRSKINLLLETAQAFCRADEIFDLDGIDEVHLGLNDLHLSMGLTFMFELLSGGLVEYISTKAMRKNIKFGFGGISRLGNGQLDSSLILSEHVRLNSSMVILSRSFHNNFGNTLINRFKEFELSDEILKINNYLNYLRLCTQEELEINRKILVSEVLKLAHNYKSA